MGIRIQSFRRPRAWAFLPSAAAILTLLLATASSSFAGSATWKATPANTDWNSAANWIANGPPNGPADTATFATSNIRRPVISATTEVNGIVFNPGASAFTITSPFFVVHHQRRGHHEQFWDHPELCLWPYRDKLPEQRDGGKFDTLH